LTAPHTRLPVEHELKTWPEFFEHVWSGEKRFELRKDDRGYQGGDSLMLREWSQANGYTGRAVRAEVTYLLGGAWPGLAPGYVCMSLSPRTQFAKYEP
jgi:hypothetical protein